LLKYDEVVGGKLDGASKAMSERNIQRHFMQTTGLSEKYLAQIRRAQDAIRQLQQGKKPSDVAAEAGYSDQPHLAKSLKKIMDRKPSDVDEIHKI
jgi:methylphosphotriester-DNA--protein-cysteine methyltransferase